MRARGGARAGCGSGAPRRGGSADPTEGKRSSAVSACIVRAKELLRICLYPLRVDVHGPPRQKLRALPSLDFGSGA
eukprot:3950171-Pyramimonas_sp.AAC.1